MGVFNIKMINSVINFKMVKDMKKRKNCVKFLVCIFTMIGLAACNNDDIFDVNIFNTAPIIALDQSNLAIEPSGDNYIFTLDFTTEILAGSVSKDDFTIDLGNITLLDTTPLTGTVSEITVEFNFIKPNTTAKDEITIIAESITGSENQTNAEGLVFYIDRAPRITSIDGNNHTELNKIELSDSDNEISYTFTFSEAISDLDGSDFVIIPANSGVSAQAVSLNSDLTRADVTFTVAENTDAVFSIALPNGSYTDVEENENKEIITDLPINITIDNIAPTIITPENFTLSESVSFITIEFDELLNFNSFQGFVLTTTDILTTNLTIGDTTIDNNGNDGKGRVVIEATIIDLTGDNPTITISSDSYSDTLGNTGENDYTLNVIIDDKLLFINNICQNFTFDIGTGSTDNPYQVSHICQLQNIDADDITIDGIAYTDLLNKNYILTKNIEATYTAEWNNGAGFVPLGDGSNSFDGTFDGGGFTISNLTISSDSNNIGLFGVNSGTIINVTLDNASVIGNENVGALVGLNSGTITNVSVKNVAVTGSDKIGGFVGFDDNGTYSGNSYCQQDSELPAVGNGSIPEIITYNENCEITFISTADELQAINDNLSRAYKLVNDIDVSTINNFIPLGDGDTPFDGIFDGGGFTISNLTISSDSNNLGLFGSNSGIIKDVTLDNVDITGNENVGAIVGANGGTIENVSVENVDITGDTNIGGFVGFDDNGTYSGNSYCPKNSELPAVGNASIPEINTYNANCEFIFISNVGELQAINNNLNGGYILINDIDASSINFTPIGDNSNPFTGVFAGSGFTISNLTISSDSNNIGLFGYNEGTIQNFTLENVDITGNENVGGLVGYNTGTIDNVTSFGIVIGNSDIGGFIGFNSGTIKNSTSFASVGDSGTNVGGFIGSDNSESYTNNRWCNPAGIDDPLQTVGDDTGDIEGIEQYICISTADELQAINSNLNEGYILINDVDATSISNFTPIGDLNSLFTGVFAGSGFTIRNLTINLSTTEYVGLFGANSGTIENVTLEDVDITANKYIGGLVGYNYNGTIENSSSSGSVKGTNKNIGGLVGYNTGTIENSSSSGSVEGINMVGGLVGNNTVIGTIENSSFSGNVSSSSASSNQVGGLIGKNDGMIEDSTSDGNVSGVFNVGGFVGDNDNTGIISNSSSSGNVSYSLSGAGGFVGNNKGTISNSSSSGDAKGDTQIGGFVGFNDNKATIDTSSSFGSVEANGSFAGGFAGWNSGAISNSNSSAESISGSVDSTGGFVGNNNNGNYIKDEWCVVSENSLLQDSGGGLIDGIAENTNCQ